MLLDYGYLTVDDNWYVTEMDAPNFCRVYYVKDGDVIYKDEITALKLKKEHLYIMSSSKAYEIKQNKENHLTCMFLHIDFFPIFIADIIEIECCKDAFLDCFFTAFLIAVKNSDKKIIESMCDTFEVFLKENKLIIQPPSIIEETAIYIEKNITNKITIEELSKLFNYNSQYFIRIFKKYAGISPHQYIINYRLKKAVKLLKKGKSITEIAEKIGYTDVKSFSRAFKLKYEISPNEFKKTYIFIP